MLLVGCTRWLRLGSNKSPCLNHDLVLYMVLVLLSVRFSRFLHSFLSARHIIIYFGSQMPLNMLFGWMSVH